VYSAGAPELTVDVTVAPCPTYWREKLRVYAANGVKEAVVVEPEANEIRWHLLDGGQYRQLRATSDGLFRSQVFPGLWLDGDALLRGDGKRLLAVVAQGIGSEEHQRFVAELARRRGGANGA